MDNTTDWEWRVFVDLASYSNGSNVLGTIVNPPVFTVAAGSPLYRVTRTPRVTVVLCVYSVSNTTQRGRHHASYEHGIRTSVWSTRVFSLPVARAYPIDEDAYRSRLRAFSFVHEWRDNANFPFVLGPLLLLAPPPEGSCNHEGCRQILLRIPWLVFKRTASQYRATSFIRS